MASSYTTNYNLDKYVGTDKPNLRDQYNAAMDKIDAALLTANTNATEAKAATQSFQGDIDAVSAAVSSEATARQNADADLATSISNETSARETAISNEASTRQSADTNLATDINNLGALLPAANFSSTNTVKKYVDDNVDTLNATMAEHTAKIASNRNCIQQNVVVIGDSYLDNFYNFSCGNYIQEVGKFANYFLFGNGGASFAHAGIRDTMNGMNWNQMVSYSAQHIGTLNVDEITDVAFIGGWNDGGHGTGLLTYNDMYTAITNARTTYPKAKIHLIYLYAGKTDVDAEHFAVYNKYRNWGIRLGVSFSACMNVMYYFTSDDGIHPLPGAEAQFLGGFCAACIACGPQEDISYSDGDNYYGVTPDHVLYTQAGTLKTGASTSTPMVTGNVFKTMKNQPRLYQAFYLGVADYGGSIGWDCVVLRVSADGINPQVWAHNATYQSGVNVFIPVVSIPLWQMHI